MFSNLLAETGSYPAGGDVSPMLLQRLRAALTVTDCTLAVFYRREDDVFVPTATLGLAHAGHYDPGEALYQGLTDGVKVCNDARLSASLPQPDLVPNSGGQPLFFAVEPVSNARQQVVALLLVGDAAPRAGLSPAQSCMLHMYAALLAVEIEPWQVCEDNIGALPLDGAEPLRLMESMVAHSSDAVLICEGGAAPVATHRIVFCNDAFSRLTGYAAKDLIGCSPERVYTEDTSPIAKKRLIAALKAGRVVEVELFNRRADGTALWIELSAVPMVDEHGRITHWMSIHRDVSQRKQAEDVANKARIAETENAALEARLHERKRVERRLTYAVFHDDLTDLYNRAYVMDRLQVVISRQHLVSEPEAALLFVDLDGFKQVNDNLGHRAGDLLLMEIARRLEHCVRGGDTLARVGGDEFVVLLEGDAADAAAAALAERIIERLHLPFRISQQDVRAGASIGIVTVRGDYATPDDLLRDADVAMYSAKRGGRGQYRFFTDSMRADALAALSLQDDLRQAAADGQFALAYQPVFDPQSGRIHAIEALMRWSHPHKGSISPDVFIPMAEEIGLIRDIGHWAMSSACRQLVDWRARYPALDDAFHLSVNVAGREIRHHRFVDDVMDALTETGLAPERLQIEITESLFLHEPERVFEVLDRVRRLGVRIALDDFGTGYSSLATIDRYEMDSLKIDPALTMRLGASARTRAIVDAILGLGRSLGVDIVAEGIETQDQLADLTAIGCARVQGELLAAPMDAASMENCLQQMLAQGD